MNFIILKIIFRKYLHISKIYYLRYDKNFKNNFSKFGGFGGLNIPHVVHYIIPV